MIHPRDFATELIENNLGPIVEVPCSYLKDILNYLWETKRLEVINPANEALAMGIASGYYLSTKRIPIVAIQNSGLMNTLNALTSLNQVYDIPVLCLITWRGEGGKGDDAPEHDITGEKMKTFLNAFGIPYEILDEQKYSGQIGKLTGIADKTKQPVALIIRKNTFEKFPSLTKQQIYNLSRYEAIEIIKNGLPGAMYVSSTGYPSRDSFAVKNSPDFYMVGSMGHTFSLALGIAPNIEKNMVVLDGDGSALMHLGGLASFDPDKYRNIFYFVLDNESYESTGGQQTVSPNVNFEMLAKAFNFKHIYKAVEAEELRRILDKLQSAKDSAFIHVKVRENQESVEGRVSDKYTCPQIKERFMESLKR